LAPVVNAFSVDTFYVMNPGLSQGSNPGLKLGNAFGVWRNAFGVIRANLNGPFRFQVS
jgi:hypothetical protein